MTYSWNRRHPVQPFQVTNHTGNANTPLNSAPEVGAASATVTFTATATGSSTRTASVTTSVVFTATATSSSTRTGSATASVSFTATASGIEIEPDTVAVVSGEPDIGGNMFNQNQSMPSSGTW